MGSAAELPETSCELTGLVVSIALPFPFTDFRRAGPTTGDSNGAGLRDARLLGELTYGETLRRGREERRKGVDVPGPNSGRGSITRGAVKSKVKVGRAAGGGTSGDAMDSKIPEERTKSTCASSSTEEGVVSRQGTDSASVIPLSETCESC